MILSTAWDPDVIINDPFSGVTQCVLAGTSVLDVYNRA